MVHSQLREGEGLFNSKKKKWKDTHCQARDLPYTAYFVQIPIVQTKAALHCE